MKLVIEMYDNECCVKAEIFSISKTQFKVVVTNTEANSKQTISFKNTTLERVIEYVNREGYNCGSMIQSSQIRTKNE